MRLPAGGLPGIANRLPEALPREPPQLARSLPRPRYQSRRPRRSAPVELTLLSLAALGVVFGDIGTSPLYAFRECFNPLHGLEPAPEAVLGVLSLIIWALLLVVSVKYLVVVMRLGNRGEGGILALLALLLGLRRRGAMPPAGIVALGLFGAALLYGDGLITPAISVLSATEGLEVAAPAFAPWVLPATVVILISLFAL